MLPRNRCGRPLIASIIATRKVIGFRPSFELFFGNTVRYTKWDLVFPFELECVSSIVLL